MLVDVDLTGADSRVDVPAVPKEMISVRRDGVRTFVRVNSSSLEIIQECGRKAQYSLVEKWRSQHESPATIFGSAFHKALEVFYSGPREARKLPQLGDMEFMAYGNRIAGEETDLLLSATRAFLDKGAALTSLPPGDKRSLPNGVWTLWNYFRAFIDDPYVAHVDDSGPFVERSFSFTLYEDAELTIEYFGTIDIVLKNLMTGELLPGDHKTTSQLFFGGDSYFDREKPNNQYTGYLLGARTAYGIESNNFLVNVIEVKARPKTERGQPAKFPRQITSRDENDFQEFRELVIEMVRTHLAHLDSNIWPLGTVTACNKYGGCQFKQVCAAPKNLRENILTAKFIKGAP